MEIKNQETHYDVIIIGGGPGGYAAALYCSRAGLSTLVLEELFAGGQMAVTTQIENYPGFDEAIGGINLAMKMEAGANQFGTTTLQEKATAIYPQETPKRVLTDKNTYTCGALILAMGAAPRKLNLPGESQLIGHGISYCATCDGALYKNQKIAVYGGGNSAVTEALFLSNFASHVYLIYRGNQLKAEQMLINQLMKVENLELIPCTKITALHGNDHLSSITLTHKQTEETRLLSVGGLFIAIGRVPNTDLCRGHLALTQDGYIPADETTRTQLPGVYAVGDLRTKPLRQIITAAADGATASIQAESYLRRR